MNDHHHGAELQYTEPGAGMSRELRQLLDEQLRTDADLDRFCIDNFPKTFVRFTNAMDRVAKVNLLLVLEKESRIRHQLRKDGAGHSERYVWALMAIWISSLLISILAVAFCSSRQITSMEPRRSSIGFEAQEVAPRYLEPVDFAIESIKQGQKIGIRKIETWNSVTRIMETRAVVFDLETNRPLFYTQYAPLVKAWSAGQVKLPVQLAEKLVQLAEGQAVENWSDMAGYETASRHQRDLAVTESSKEQDLGVETQRHRMSPGTASEILSRFYQSCVLDRKCPSRDEIEQFKLTSCKQNAGNSVDFLVDCLPYSAAYSYCAWHCGKEVPRRCDPAYRVIVRDRDYHVLYNTAISPHALSVLCSHRATRHSICGLSEFVIGQRDIFYQCECESPKCDR